MEKIYGLRFEMTPLYRISAFVIDANKDCYFNILYFIRDHFAVLFLYV